MDKNLLLALRLTRSIMGILCFTSIILAGAENPDGSVNFGWTLLWIAVAFVAVHLVVAVAFEDVEEEIGDGGKLFARAVEGHHGVLEVRRGGIVDNLFDILFGCRNRLFKGGQIVFGFDIAERRGLPRRGPFLG